MVARGRRPRTARLLRDGRRGTSQFDRSWTIGTYEWADDDIAAFTRNAFNVRDLRIPRLDHGETEPLVADDESLNALRPGDMVALYHSSFGRFYGVVLEFDAGELTIATYEWADDDVPLTVATVEWFNVDIIPRSQLDDGWRSIIAGWMRTLGAPDAFS